MRKRGARCTVCAHKARHQIEIGLANGLSVRAMAARHGLTHHAIRRHAKNHVNDAMRAAILTAAAPSAVDLDELRKSESEGLLASVRTQRARLQQHVELATSFGDVKAAISAESAITANLTLTAKLLGQLVQHHQVTHASLLVSPDYLRLREALVLALRPFPEAARAVGAALHRLESEAAKDITSTGKGTAPALIEHQP